MEALVWVGELWDILFHCTGTLCPGKGGIQLRNTFLTLTSNRKEGERERKKEKSKREDMSTKGWMKS